MAKYGGSSVEAILVGGYNLIPSVLTQLDGPQLESVLGDVTGLGSSWRNFQATGTRLGSLGVEGYFDDASTGIIATLSANEGTSRVLSATIHGNTLGAKSFCAGGSFGAQWARQAKIDDLTRARATFTISGQVDDDAVILFPLQALTVDTNSEGANSQDAGASSSSGAVGYLHVTAYSGFTSLVAKVRHSSDDVTYGDLLTFTTITGTGGERVAVAGTVNRHTAVDLNVTGAGSVTVFVALKRL